MKKSKAWLLPAISAGVIALAACGTCMGASSYYKTRFYDNTFINNVDCSNLTVPDVLRTMGVNSSKLKLKFTAKDGKTEFIKGAEIDLESSAEDVISELIENQHQEASWFKSLPVAGAAQYNYDVDFDITYNTQALEEKIKNLEFVVSGTTPSTDATLEYGPSGYYIKEETLGDIVDVSKLIAGTEKGLAESEFNFDLLELDCYDQPKIKSTDPELSRALENVKAIESVVITYDFGNTTEVLDKSRFLDWITLDQSGSVGVNYEDVKSYVRQLAYKYDTFQTERAFTTHSGETIKIGGTSYDTYGWQIDVEEETQTLAKTILMGSSVTREPVYKIQGFTRGEDDIGNTYIEVSITDQHLWYYKDGEVFLETDVISGYPYNGNSTPNGVFCVWSREKDRQLVGETYNTHVDYWMPFTWTGCGLHDAWWQSGFGGQIYKTAAGSHGCINLPTNVAKTIYENVAIRTPVIVYEE